MELYIHIPFCVKKCDYCDFLSAPADMDTTSHYMDRLKEQLAYQAALLRETKGTPMQLDSVFVGGGTPTILSGRQLEELFCAIYTHYAVAEDAEITVEANPGTLTKEKAQLLAALGVNRVSLGLQSANETELRLLGRIHTYEDFLRSYECVRAAGILNVNVDLMSALPGQSLLSYEKTLRRVLALHPEHISAYSLIIEEGTPFFERYRADEKLRDAGEMPHILPDEKSEREMYERTGELLSEFGYERYEISNYARAGFACRHNIGYWTGVEYIGLGLGASSYVDGCRYKNTDALADYLAGDFSPYECERLSRRDAQAEFFYLGLRMSEGVKKSDFVNRFGMHPMRIYGEVLSDLIEKKLLIDTGDGYRLTPFGRDISNQVLYRFL